MLWTCFAISELNVLASGGFCGSRRVLVALWLAVPAGCSLCGIVSGSRSGGVRLTDGDAF